MYSEAGKSEGHRQRRRRGHLIAGMILAGVAVILIDGPLREELGHRPPAVDIAPGHGLSTGSSLPMLLGGFRAITADFIWLRAHQAWESREVEATGRWCRLAVRIDPRPRYFWVNAARIFAYDLADERIRQAGGGDRIPEAVIRQINEEQAEQALRLLAEALVHHPEDPLLLIEMAGIHLNRRGDVQMAAEAFEQAARHPQAPLFVERIHAGLLWRLGDRAGALNRLQRHHQRLLQTLDGVDPLLLAGVEARLAAMEEDLEAIEQ